MTDETRVESPPVLPDGYKPSCSNWRCSCWVPGAVCEEFMGYAMDRYCPRCGWDRALHGR